MKKNLTIFMIGQKRKKKPKKYYAAMIETDENDWGYAYYNKKEAAKMIRIMKKSDNKKAYIAIIDETGNEPKCIGVINDVRGM